MLYDCTIACSHQDIGVFNGFSMVLGILSWVGGSAVIMSVVETAGGVGQYAWTVRTQ